MQQPCFFCDIQQQNDENIFLENEDFFARFDDFPVSKGHAEIIPKAHIASFFSLTSVPQKNFFDLLYQAKDVIQERFTPDAFNIGINDGKAAGQSVFHLHVHIMPRYIGDVSNPRGGVRNMFPGKGDYIDEVKDMPDRMKYVAEA